MSDHDPERLNHSGPTYVGAKTFLNAPEADPHDLPAATDIGVVGVPFDGGVSRQPGARYGPEELRRESGWYARSDGGFNAATGRRVDFDGVTIRDCGDAPIVTTDVEATGDGIRETVRGVAETGFRSSSAATTTSRIPRFAVSRRPVANGSA